MDAEQMSPEDRAIAKFAGSTKHNGAKKKGNTRAASPLATAVDSAELLNSVCAFLSRFVAFPSPACLDTATLWAAHAHMVEHFHTVGARLNLTSSAR